MKLVKTEIKDSILNYNRLNYNLNFENFIQGKRRNIVYLIQKKYVNTYQDIILYIFVEE